jgi:heme-degrading monooxygenase HmoA
VRVRDVATASRLALPPRLICQTLEWLAIHDTSVRDVPGFTSAALHRTVDGTRVTMYAQWKSAEHYQHYQSMRSNPVASPYVEQALAIAKFDSGMYEVVKVFAGPSKPTR